MFIWNRIEKITIVLSLLLLTIACTSESEKVPLIEIEDFFKNPERINYQISPDGNQISFLKPWQNRMNIYVQKGVEGEAQLITTSTERDIEKYIWANDERIVYLQDKDGDGQYHVYGVNINGEQFKDLTPYTDVSVYILDLLESFDSEILILMNKNDIKKFDAYKLNVLTGETKLVYENPGNVKHWVFDHNGELRILSATDGVNTVLLYKNENSESFETVLRNDYKKELIPLEFTYDNKFVYCLSNLNSDKTELVTYDFVNKKIVETIFSHPEVDAQGILKSDMRKKIIDVSYTTWKKEYKFYDKLFEDTYNYIVRKLKDYEVEAVSFSKDETKVLIKAYNDRNLGIYYYYDFETKELNKLAETNPSLNEKDLARVKPIRFKSRDNKTIHGYLTLPKGKEALDLPVVVYPHGGPWIRDVWKYNSDVQFFANRGYAVLQINFRGSEGYGKEFWQAGFKEWGGKIQDDITDGTYWLINQGIADKDNILIYGKSFGGYAALMGVVNNPKLYSSCVSYAGITDIRGFLNSIPPQWENFRAMIYEMVGDPVKDSIMLKRRSPYHNVSSIKVPVLLVHGAKDTRAPISFINDMVVKLKEKGVEVEYLVEENEGHGFKNEENKIKYYNTLERFLARNLDGRIKMKRK